MKDFAVILKRNFISPVVISIFLLSVTLLVLGEARDAWFISSVISINTILAIIQEFRARTALKKLELMSAPHARKITDDGTTVDIMYDQLNIGDKVQLKIGDEIPADGIIIEDSGLEVDESILTGESAPVEKQKQSIVLASCAVVAGSGIMEVTSVGANTKAGKMSSELKRYEPEQTPIQHKIFKAITALTYGALLLAALIFVVYALSGQDAIRIFKTITSGAVAVVPEGLLLASSLLLAYGSLKLAQSKVLPQKLSAIEAMALLDVLCVDKTGTLTSEQISFESIESFKNNDIPINELVSIVAAETSGGSKTGLTIASAVELPKTYTIIENLSFSSARKYSGVKTKYNGKIYSVLMGAPEYLSKIAKLSKDEEKRIIALTNYGKRVLLFVAITNNKLSLKKVKENTGKAVGIIVLSNGLRDGVTDTISYLQERNVSVRVISGDNPNTVSYIAGEAGIDNHENILTGFELSKISNDEWDEKILDTVVFARVLPEQKVRIVETFMRSGKFTGMVGDGINDSLAIKKSDLGIAMFDGATVTRRVADVILLNNSFNSLPIGMKLGNRIMQAIEIIATLFFHKISYSVVLLLSTLALGIPYPFAPRHITFMNMFLVSMPTLMWTIFTPRPAHKVSPKSFWKDTLWAVMPIAVISGIVVSISYAFLNAIHPNDTQAVSTTTVIIATFFGIYLVFLMPKMFNIIQNREAKLARLLYILSVVFVVVVSFGIGFVRDFFDFTTPAWKNTLPLLVMIICAILFQNSIAKKSGDKLKKRHEQ